MRSVRVMEILVRLEPVRRLVAAWLRCNSVVEKSAVRTNHRGAENTEVAQRVS
jgi:hypothetical protein